MRLASFRNVFQHAGVPVAGTDEIQTATFGGTWQAAETFRLRYEGEVTAPITWSATNATLVSNIQTALRALPAVNGANLTAAVGTMTNGIGTITLTFVAALGKLAVNTITVAANGSASGTLAVAETTPGVSATGRGAPKGALVVDTATGIWRTNTGTAQAPTWTVVGTQT
jgi:hypothetical protein